MNENTEIDPTYDRIDLRPAYGIDLRQTFSAMLMRDVCVLTFSTPSTTFHIHLDRSSLTEIWETLANLDANNEDPNYDSLRDIS